jgi:hypothetical protein
MVLPFIEVCCEASDLFPDLILVDVKVVHEGQGLSQDLC